MSGGGNPVSAAWQSAKDSPAEGINSLFGTNLLGAGGISNDAGTQWANGLTGYNVGNAGNPASNAQQAAAAAANPQQIGNLGASTLYPISPQGAFQPVNVGMGGINAMANQGAGPLFNPGIQQPGLQPFFQGPNYQVAGMPQTQGIGVKGTPSTGGYVNNSNVGRITPTHPGEPSFGRGML